MNYVAVSLVWMELITGPTAIAPPPFVEVVAVESAADMFDAVAAHSPAADFVFKAAAVADYTFPARSDQKLKKSDGELTLSLQRTRDILAWLGQNRKQPFHHSGGGGGGDAGSHRHPHCRV